MINIFVRWHRLQAVTFGLWHPSVCRSSEGPFWDLCCFSSVSTSTTCKIVLLTVDMKVFADDTNVCVCLNQSINQLINRSINQSVSQSISMLAAQRLERSWIQLK